MWVAIYQNQVIPLIWSFVIISVELTLPIAFGKLKRVFSKQISDMKLIGEMFTQKILPFCGGSIRDRIQGLTHVKQNTLTFKLHLQLFLILIFFFFWWYWGLNSGP
jgi:hypothetical protein